MRDKDKIMGKQVSKTENGLTATMTRVFDAGKALTEQDRAGWSRELDLMRAMAAAVGSGERAADVRKVALSGVLKPMSSSEASRTRASHESRLAAYMRAATAIVGAGITSDIQARVIVNVARGYRNAPIKSGMLSELTDNGEWDVIRAVANGTYTAPAELPATTAPAVTSGEGEDNDGETAETGETANGVQVRSMTALERVESVLAYVARHGIPAEDAEAFSVALESLTAYLTA